MKGRAVQKQKLSTTEDTEEQEELRWSMVFLNRGFDLTLHSAHLIWCGSTCLVRILVVKNSVHAGIVGRALLFGALVVGLLPGSAWAKDESKWIEVHTTDFSVMTDAGEKRGREVALRMEQMRAVFGQLISKTNSKCRCPSL